MMLALAMCVGVAATAAAQDARAKGEQLFADQKCTLCHSVGERGNKKGPLDGVASKASAARIREWITDAEGMTAKTKATRKPEMKAFSLPKDDVVLRTGGSRWSTSDSRRDPRVRRDCPSGCIAGRAGRASDRFRGRRYLRRLPRTGRQGDASVHRLSSPVQTAHIGERTNWAGRVRW